MRILPLLHCVVPAILLTIYKDRIWKPLPAEAENLRASRYG